MTTEFSRHIRPMPNADSTLLCMVGTTLMATFWDGGPVSNADSTSRSK
eukprot:CAMPEP_0184471314 /NCGR_PEP_ID=MMETSP0740-20130409/100517_1 /TAXON_ID=385413 /ORGANISM="Thalassiosira miniscula, Strain CCMP1093" /LENGTH=47 /DNA_ID= /DNA_START= /DNA_END= /DNA_ORIENTATION=